MTRTQRALFWQIAGFLVALTLLFVGLRFSPVVDLVSNLQQRVVHWGVWSAVAYPILFAVCNLLLLPGGILCIGSGFFFGLWWGFFLVLIGNTIAAAIAFRLTRSFGHEWLNRKIARSPTLKGIEPAAQREGWKIIFLSQLHPLFPTSLLNYIYGLTNIRFSTYMLWTTLGRIPGLFLYVYLGTLSQLGLRVATGTNHPKIVEYWTWGGALVLTALLLLVLSRLALRTVAGAEMRREQNENKAKVAEVSLS
jgi:uncharacterized membrane protein YdjX (TVP38/TMEM64 family)